jgi:cell division protein FtsI (penicillin-binding protein 3)
LNKPLELEIKGEGIPSMKYPGDKDWWGTSLAWMSYGYELKLTPLQVLTFYNAVANNGKMVKPSFIKEISRGGLVVKSFNPEVLNPMIVSSETLAKAKKMLEGVCETGTGQSLSNPVFKIAGKTGTAQIVANGEYGEGLYLASFAGYFPADDPVYSLIVTLNRPKGAYYGGSVAGPVFKEIAEKVYAATFGISRQIVSMKPEKNTILPEFKNGRREDVQKIIDCLKIESNLAPVHSEFVEMKKTDNHIEWEEITVASGKVPDVSGMVASDAVFLLENAGLKVKIQGTGRVRKQSLLPGAEYRYGQWIFITLS